MYQIFHCLVADNGEELIKCAVHKEIFNRMQECMKFLLFHIYMKLNMDVVRHTVPVKVQQLHAQQLSTYGKP